MAIISDSTGAQLVGMTMHGQIIDSPIVAWHLTTEDVKPVLPRIQLTDLFDYAIKTGASLITRDGDWYRPEDESTWLDELRDAYERYLNDGVGVL